MLYKVSNTILVSFQGVIRDDKDLQLLGPEFVEAYRKRDDDPFQSFKK